MFEKISGGPTQNEILALSLFKSRQNCAGTVLETRCGTGKVPGGNSITKKYRSNINGQEIHLLISVCTRSIDRAIIKEFAMLIWSRFPSRRTLQTLMLI